MTKRRTRLTILCEDLQQEVFARKFFMSHGFLREQLEFKTAPKAKGSAEQFVREHYSQEVRIYRSQSSYRSVLLAVVIDADTNTMQQRLTQLDAVLASDGQQQRQANEKIAIFVPKRNIETWIHYLMEKNPVSEKKKYPKFHKTGTCKPYVEDLVKNTCSVGLPENAPPSLYTACNELERIL